MDLYLCLSIVSKKKKNASLVDICLINHFVSDKIHDVYTFTSISVVCVYTKMLHIPVRTGARYNFNFCEAAGLTNETPNISNDVHFTYSKEIELRKWRIDKRDIFPSHLSYVYLLDVVHRRNHCCIVSYSDRNQQIQVRCIRNKWLRSAGRHTNQQLNSQ